MNHKWWIWRGIECCEVCGVVKRRDGQNLPCKGPTAIGLRTPGKDTPLSHIPLEVLEARFIMRIKNSDSWTTTENLSEADGVLMLCPKCYYRNNGVVGTHSVLLWFDHVPRDASLSNGRWTVRAGTGIVNLSLTPSVDLSRTCGWHGYVHGGQATLDVG